jgi:maltose O-acetyltransferase
MTTEWNKMLAGELYLSGDAELVTMRHHARRLLANYRNTDPADADGRFAILHDLFGQVSRAVEIEPPFYCDYGRNIYLGSHFYANFNCVILDPAEVRIGDYVFFAPGVQVYTAYHPLLPEERNSGYELASPVTIGNNVWVGGGAIIQPGVTIGDNTTIGAGSVVTKNIPANVVAAGVPCRVLRELPYPSKG